MKSTDIDRQTHSTDIDRQTNSTDIDRQTCALTVDSDRQERTFVLLKRRENSNVNN
jgi:hypothetical protein